MKAQFVCPIYPVRIIVSVAEKDQIDTVRKSCDRLLEPSRSPIRWARCDSSSETGCCGLFFIEPALKDEGAIAHEITHLSLWICHYCQVPVEWPNDEAYAHLVGFLTIKINGILRRFKTHQIAKWGKKKVNHRRTK